MIINTLVADDDSLVLKLIEIAISKEGINDVKYCNSIDKFKSSFNKDTHIAILDLYMPGTLGTELLEYCLSNNPDCYCIVLSGNGDMELVIDCVNLGAKKYINKSEPTWTKYLVEFIKDAAKNIKLNIELKEKLLELELQDIKNKNFIITKLENAIHSFNRNS